MECPNGEISFWLAATPGREAKENIVFFVAQRSTTLSAGLAEAPTGLRRLAARQNSLVTLQIALKVPKTKMIWRKSTKIKIQQCGNEKG